AIWLQTLLECVKPSTNTSAIPAEVICRVATGITVTAGTAPFPELSPEVYDGGQTVNAHQGHHSSAEIVEHGGDVTGLDSRVVWLPLDNIGLAVLKNDDDAGFTSSDRIKYRLIEVALGFNQVDWSSRFAIPST
ncbi:hypothetical protein BDZ94DRAFT_1168367, partial [Collybia nuda]